MVNKTKIIATIGPACDNSATLQSMVDAGVNAFRLNMSHGDKTSKQKMYHLIKSLQSKNGQRPYIITDLAGPKIRITDVLEDFVLEEGQAVTITNEKEADNEHICVTNKIGFTNVSEGARILINDGRIQLKIVKAISPYSLKCQTEIGGNVQLKRGVNFPGITLDLPILTKQDKSDLIMALEEGADWIALSFVRSAEDLDEVTKVMDELNIHLPVMAKIEKWEALNNIDAITESFDAVMVARGDLGVEIPAEQVPLAQKNIIKVAGSLGKPVIIATQMLESMTENPQPTRAEVTDVHNAVIDGSDAIMLSGETSIGKFPVRSVEFMKEIAEIAEKNINNNYLRKLRFDHVTASNAQNIDEFIAHGAADIAEQLNAKLIVAFTESGSTAARVASYKPSKPVIALSPDPKAHISLSLRWGVYTIKAKNLSNIEEMFQFAEDMVSNEKLAKKGETIIVVAGLPIGFKGNTNLIRVITIK